MIYLVFDTNIWLYLANGFDSNTSTHTYDQHFNLLSSLVGFYENEEAIVLVNDIIIDEWGRNRKHTEKLVEKLKNKRENAKNIFRDIEKYTNKSSDLIKLRKDYEEGINNEIRKNEQHIVDVENFLLNKSVKIPISEKVKSTVWDLSTKKKAPFHNSKNNTADATILLCSAEYIEGLSYEENQSAFFISNNTDEFANKDKNDFHPDISEILGLSILKYERNLSKAIKLSQGIIIEIEEYQKHQAWLESVSFSCRTGFCERNEDFTPWGYLDETVIVKYKSNELIDSRQLSLFPDMPIIKKNEQEVKCGSCVICGTAHFECPECEELIANELGEVFTCPYCNTEFEIEDGCLIVNDVTEKDSFDNDEDEDEEII